MRKLIIGVLIIIVMIVTLVGISCGPKEEAPAKELIYASIGPFSGSSAAWGYMQSYSAQVVASWINAEGMTIKGQKYVWKVKEYDDKYTPSETVEAARRAIFNDHAQAIYVTGPGPCTAAAPLMEEQEVIYSASCAIPELNNPDHPLYFSIIWCETTMLTYPWAKGNLGIKTVAMLNPDHGTGWAFRDIATKFGAPYAGVQIVASELFPYGTTDFYPMLTKVIATKPDMIDTGVADGSATALIIKQARELGYKGQMMVSNAVNIPAVISIAGKEACEGVVFLSALGDPPHFDTAKEQQFYNELVQKYGAENWCFWDMMAADPLLLISEAMVKAQSLKADDIMATLTTMKVEKSLFGNDVYFGGEKMYGTNSVEIFPFPWGMVKDGKEVWITTKSLPAGAM